ncbi:hypothetical protein HDV57DRAFT_467768 [Trichoderma longibrachiatum]|uniref:Uncharacterized protein n=1 Tax=Trichoderma longibrachiatum ATCC 18648 TaxID=983965 RepID=A0A2T4C5R6_TRILO|nr:hypothetical protein M440DRAFT_1237524 [Trichoderma longibrachiatum ATCC 18648]
MTSEHLAQHLLTCKKFIIEKRESDVGERQKRWYSSATPRHTSQESSSPPNHGNETTISASSSPIIAHLHNRSSQTTILNPPLPRSHLYPCLTTELSTPRINDDGHSDIRRTSENPTGCKSPPITSSLIMNPPHLPSPSSTQSVLGSCHYKSDPPSCQREQALKRKGA